MTDGPVQPPGQKEQEGEIDGQTGILPKSILAGKDFKVGEELVLKIMRIGEKDVEVAYAPEKEEAPKEEGEGAVPVDRSTMEMGAGMNSMME